MEFCCSSLRFATKIFSSFFTLENYKCPKSYAEEKFRLEVNGDGDSRFSLNSSSPLAALFSLLHGALALFCAELCVVVKHKKLSFDSRESFLAFFFRQTVSTAKRGEAENLAEYFPSRFAFPSVGKICPGFRERMNESETQQQLCDEQSENAFRLEKKLLSRFATRDKARGQQESRIW